MKIRNFRPLLLISMSSTVQQLYLHMSAGFCGRDLKLCHWSTQSWGYQQTVLSSIAIRSRQLRVGPIARVTQPGGDSFSAFQQLAVGVFGQWSQVWWRHWKSSQGLAIWPWSLPPSPHEAIFLSSWFIGWAARECACLVEVCAGICSWPACSCTPAHLLCLVYLDALRH